MAHRNSDGQKDIHADVGALNRTDHYSSTGDQRRLGLCMQNVSQIGFVSLLPVNISFQADHVQHLPLQTVTVLSKYSRISEIFLFRCK